MSHFEGIPRILLLLVSFISEFLCNDLHDLNYGFDGRIVGGYKCKNPFIVSIHALDPRDKDYDHHCGGTTVNEKWVLSAAHCYQGEDIDYDIDDYLVVAGISKLSEFLNKNAQKSKVKTIVTEEYDSDTENNDIALLKLKTPLTKTKTVQFVTLPKVSIFPTDISEKYKKCTAMGWGITAKMDFEGTVSPNDADDVVPDHLMCVELPPIKFSKCRKIFHDLNKKIKLTNNQICTLHPDPKGGKDFCGGDSGGPLICGGLQHGVTSWGLGCAQPGVPGVFTRVDKYINWIKFNIKIYQTQKFSPPTGIVTRNGTSNNSLKNIVILLLIFSNLLSIWKCTCN